MTDVKPIGISPSQSQQQPQSQPQPQQQPQQQQMMIATHDLQQQQNVQQPQQQQQQHVQQSQQAQQAQQVQQSQQVQQQQVQSQQQIQQQVQSQQQMQVQQQVQQQQQQAQQSQQQQQNNGPHSVVSNQVQVQPQVAASMPQQQLQGAVTVSMHQQPQVQQGGVSMTLSGQQGATTITTMAAHPQAVQVIQQPIQSQAYHLQQLYNPQGTPLLMPGNLALHPAGINPSSIQLITAGKPFQSAAQLTPHMLTTASTPGQGGGHPGAGGPKVQGFPTGYLPVPTSATPGAGQTLVFGQLGVLGSPHPPPSLQQQQQQQQSANKPDQVQKYTACTTGASSGGRGGGMQFAPWQFTPQVWTAGLQQPTLLTAAPNQIFIRGPTQPDMYIQSPQPLQAHNALTTQQQIQGVQQIAAASGKTAKVMDIQQQQGQPSKPNTSGQRPLSILPSSMQAVQTANMRAASSVSTQTVHGIQAQTGKSGGGGGKGRGKPIQAPQQQQQQAQQSTQHQQVFIQQKQHTQQQQQLQQQYQQQVQSSQQQIQPKPIMTNMTLPQQQQPGVVLGTDRPIMPVVSVAGVGIGVATASQMNPVAQSSLSTVQQLPLPAINPTIIGNQIVSGASQVQAMPIVNATTQDQPTHDNANSTTMITSPDRNPQTECSLILPSATNSAVTDDSVKLLPKKEEIPVAMEEVAATPQMEVTDTEDQCKPVVLKEEEVVVPKVEEKPCNNPLAGLANTVNAITNGVVGDESTILPICAPVTVNSKQAPPKAMVKPQVLTHVIEGFVIQEASEPFAVSQETTNILNRSNTATERDTYDEPPRKKRTLSYSNEEDGTSGQVNKCENCGNALDEQNVKLKKEKRFCSSICAKSRKRETRDRDGTEKQWTEIETETKTVDNDMTKKNGEERSSTTTTSSTDESLPKVNPVKWTVGEVCDFIRGLPGCADYAEDFAIQEIDGQALMLLKEDHLMSAMSIKLGPALKIVARIDSMRVESMSNSSPSSNNS
ncbi:hypothetical protein DMN91_012652 [Ooceraea biroi]|uniref:Polyhomeotic-like protein n=1 Tax=Ooceraea biroi TaxID=2015173 RepID=A0A026W569_OOCBI|nr:polyhomeotic-proximal chromatin protein [Ooceraea biroi]XP_011343686.1 polyhomeotic-proximal chromatin protein [Ooceraea biroi]XP_011343687.1 polyhomeotic-proximal chromatin protein [Ooceraea biroi]EZA51225.1 Polyhomeotic-like protein [Ooceraea biroi]RLU14765.1 hypothetical protein DMN91_012652 [Ooceraea biroi]